MTDKLNVLLVEDSEEDAELLFLELRRGGLKVDITRVETEHEFRTQLDHNGWDLILSDYNLPTFNAPSALKIAVEHASDLPFIITSGAVAAEDVVTLLKAGAHDFLEKNDLARLVPAIERELREAKVRAESRKAETTLKKLFRAVEQSPVSVIITDEKGRVEYVNPRYEKATGYSAEEVAGMLPDVMAGDFVSLEQNAEIWDHVNTGKEWRGEFCNQHKDGGLFWEYVTIAPIRNDDGTLTNLLISKEDITFRKETEEKLYRQANFDDLTKLPNRLLILDRLSQALERPDNTILITVDLDNFKKMNDSLGHTVGDLLLIETAERLRGVIEAGQTVGRVSGDEFAIVIPEIKNLASAETIISRILDCFAAPYEVEEHELFLTVSAGVTVSPDDGNDPGILFRNAEAAMRLAKEEGRNGFRFFAQQMNIQAEERLTLEAGLRKALDNKELSLYYQPIMDSQGTEIAGAEALIRWIHPEKGLVPPDDFISLAEETGLILPIGQWVIEQACLAAKRFHAAGHSDMYVTVNASPQQIWSGTFVDDIRGSLANAGLDPQYLVVEMTENVCLDDTQNTLSALQEVVNLGVRLAVDDFGTGYSSLSYLKRYPFSILKIDRAFVRDIPQDSDDMALVDAMIAMAHSLGLKVVAEGVENGAHVGFLLTRKCDLLQGYHFSRPVPEDEFLTIKAKAVEAS